MADLSKTLKNGVNFLRNDNSRQSRDLLQTSNTRKAKEVSFDVSSAGKFELFCIFVCALGVSIGFTATLSCVNYITAVFSNKNIFLYLCCGVYGPTLPVVMFQLNCDQPLDRRWGSSRTYFWRVTLAFICHIACALYLPYSSGVDPDFQGKRRYVDLLIPVTIIGLETSILHGIFFQLVSFIQFERKGAGAAAFTFGYQGSGFLSLAITFACGGIGTEPTAMKIDLFFFSVAGVEVLALLCFGLMAWTSVPFSQGLERRDEEMKWLTFKGKLSKKRKRNSSKVNNLYASGKKLLQSSLLADYDKQYSNYDFLSSEQYSADESVGARSQSIISSYYTGNECTSDISEKDGDVQIRVFSELVEIVGNMESASKTFVFRRIWPCILGLCINIFGSIFLMPFYSYIPGSTTLPQILFYTKLFSDTFSRPLTMIIPKPKSKYWYLLLTFIRLAVFLPIVFLYIFNLLGIRNDFFIIGVVSLYSLTSGLLGTFGYQLAPTLVEHQNAKLVAANQMNLSFNTGCCLALVASFTIIGTVNLV